MNRVRIAILVVIVGTLSAVLLFRPSTLAPRGLYIVSDIPSIADPHTMPDFRGFEYGFPDEVRRRYETGHGNKHVYLVQEPENEVASGPRSALIFMHGASGDETEGMGHTHAQDSFKRLRTLLADRGWVYVTPLYPDFVVLREELRDRYGVEDIYLSGASQGGKQVFEELLKNPTEYAGAILLCPAISFPEHGPPGLGSVDAPIWLESGSDDGMIALFSRRLAVELRLRSKEFTFVEIPGGDHGAPVNFVDWAKALDFVARKD